MAAKIKPYSSKYLKFKSLLSFIKRSFRELIKSKRTGAFFLGLFFAVVPVWYTIYLEGIEKAKEESAALDMLDMELRANKSDLGYSLNQVNAVLSGDRIKGFRVDFKKLESFSYFHGLAPSTLMIETVLTHGYGAQRPDTFKLLGLRESMQRIVSDRQVLDTFAAGPGSSDAAWGQALAKIQMDLNEALGRINHINLYDNKSEHDKDYAAQKVKTLGNLDAIRSSIDIYYADNSGEYPKTLHDTLNKNQVTLPMEAITGSNREVDAFDGQGGWIYLSTTGEVKVNVSGFEQ